MSWQNPALIALALPLGALIVALYLLRMKRRDMVVPASFLWPERLDEVRANSLFQKLKFSWLMVLQLAALLALAAALAQPQFRQEGLAGGLTVVVLDASASMTAKDGAGGRTRFEEGASLVEQMISGAKAGDQLALIWAGPIPRVAFSLSSDPARQRAALEPLRPTEAPGDMGEALRLAASLVGAAEGGRIVLISDGVFPQVEDFSAGKASFAYRKVGRDPSNLGIETLSTDPERGLGFVSVRAHGGWTGAATVTLEADGKVVNSAQVQPGTGGFWSKAFPIPSSRVVTARLRASDALAADNFAAAYGRPSNSLRVLLVGEGSLFLERALALDPRVTLDKSPAVPAGASGAYDIVVFDGVKPSPVAGAGILVFGPESEAASDRGTMTRPQASESEPHPALRDVDLKGVYVEKSSRLAPRSGARVIASSEGGPWMAALEGRPYLHVGFLLKDTDWPLSVSFPIFVSRALDWLGSREGEGATVVATGQPFSVVGSGGRVSLDGPAKVQDQAVEPGVFPSGVPLAGVYQGGSQRVFASLRDKGESAIAPQENLDLGAVGAQGRSAVQRLADIWKPLVLLVLAVLAAEWWLFARRS